MVWPLCPLRSKSVLGYPPLECLVTIWNYACCYLEIASSNSLPKGKCFGTFSLMRPLGFDSPKQPLIFHCGRFLRGGLTVVVSSKWKASFCQGWCGQGGDGFEVFEWWSVMLLLSPLGWRWNNNSHSSCQWVSQASEAFYWRRCSCTSGSEKF